MEHISQEMMQDRLDELGDDLAAAEAQLDIAAQWISNLAILQGRCVGAEEVREQLLVMYEEGENYEQE